MLYTVYDDYELAIKSDKKNIALVNPSLDGKSVPDTILFDEIIANSSEIYPFKMFKLFTEKEITEYEYEIITEYPKQYAGVCSDDRIYFWNKEKKEVEPFHSSFIDLINSGYSKLPFGYKIENGELVVKSEDDELTDEEKPTWYNIKINEMEAYLKETDWYSFRYAETGKAIPEDVLEKRAMCREKISEYKEYLNKGV